MMETKELKTSTFSQVLLWFGAAVSISELMTGALIAPLFAVSFTDYFLLHHRKIRPQDSLNVRNLILWLIGFFAYRLLISYNTIVGITLPVMLGLVAVSYIWRTAERKTHEQKI